MATVAVSRLKARLSEFLVKVKRGEELIVTERGKPVARIVPVTPADEAEERRLERLEKAGVLRRGSGRLPRGFWKWPRPKDPRGLVLKALLEEREEGR